MSDYPVTITAREIHVGDDIFRERIGNIQGGWSGIITEVERAIRQDGAEIRRVRVFDGKWSNDKFLDLDAPVVRKRSGFTELWREGWPFQLGLKTCSLCRGLIEEGSESEHTNWHVSILARINSASTAYMDLSGGR